MHRHVLCLSAVLFGFLSVACAQSPAYRWSSRRPPYGVDLVQDGARGITVLLEPDGPSSEALFGLRTWELLGDCWVERTDARLPQAFRRNVTWSPFGVATRSTVATFDPATNKVLVFGYDQQSVGRTYLYDGDSWTLAASGGPSPRVQAAAAADHANGRTLLFGGRRISSGAVLADTWSWDGTSWSLASGSSAPGARSSSHLAFNPVTGRVTLVGGYDANSSFTGLSDVFEWTGTAWQSVSTVPPHDAPPRFFSSMPGGVGCYALLYGAGGTPAGLYLWDGTAWAEVSGSGVNHKMSFVVASPDSQVWLDGPGPWQYRTRTFQPSSGQWQALCTMGSPRGYLWKFTTVAPEDALICRTGSSLSGGSEFWRLEVDGTFTHLLTAAQDNSNPNLVAYHPPSGNVVLLDSSSGETSAFTGSTVVSGGVLPSAAGSAYLVGYHPPSGYVLALAEDAASHLQIWGFAAQTWTLLATGPVVADLPIGAFDGARNRLVYSDRSGTAYGEWDGLTFTTVPGPPGAPAGYCMTPHPDGGVARMQWNTTGGAGYEWEAIHRWDGSSWTTAQIANPIRVTTGYDPLHYDAVRRRWTMLFDGAYDLESTALTSDEHVPLPGTTVTYTFDRSASANLPWLVVLSTAISPGIPWRPSPWYGTERIPLEHDWLLDASLGLGMFGVLDAQGQGQAQLVIPNVPQVGFRAYAAAVTLGQGQLFEFVSAPVPLTVRN